MTALRRRVAIAVAPRLLGDALSKVLQREGCDVVVLPAEDQDQGSGSFDLVLVTGSAPSTVNARIVIHLPETPTIGIARVGDERVALRTLDDLVALVDRLAPVGIG